MVTETTQRPNEESAYRYAVGEMKRKKNNFQEENSTENSFGGYRNEEDGRHRATEIMLSRGVEKEPKRTRVKMLKMCWVYNNTHTHTSVVTQNPPP